MNISIEEILNPRKRRENMLRIIEMRHPKWINFHFGILQAAWSKYRDDLKRILENHPSLFPNFKGSVCYDCFGVRRKGHLLTDEWGCVWAYNLDGLAGQVVEHPLDEWSKLDKLHVPDPELGVPSEGNLMRSWELVEEEIEHKKRSGDFVGVNFTHGFMFMRLHYLRGFTNLMMDMVRKEPKLDKLIDLIVEYNVSIVKRLCKLGVDMIYFGDDLGLQDRMPIGRELFRRYIYPAYSKIFGEARKSGVHVYLHSDGHIMEVVDDIIESGVSVLNIQDRVNGVENIARKCKGRVAIDLDIDRQRLLPFATPTEIREYIESEIQILGSRRGGLMMVAEINVDVPLDNVEAVCQTFEDNFTAHLNLP